MVGLELPKNKHLDRVIPSIVIIFDRGRRLIGGECNISFSGCATQQHSPEMMYNTINNRPLQIILACFRSCAGRFHQGEVFFGEERQLL